MNEGIWSIPDSPGGGYPFGPTQQGGGYQGWGGTADAWNPQGNASYGFVIPGVATNQDPVSASGNPAGAVASRYYQGYWAGVQEALYNLPSANPFLSFGFTPPVSPFGAHSYGFAVDVLQALAQPPTQDLRAHVAAAAGALDHVSHPFELWLTSPTAQTDWYLGSGVNGDWPVDLPDWGDRPPGPPPMPGFSPIKGKWSDVSPFPQYFSPGQLQQYQNVNPELAPDANPDDFFPFMIETFKEATGQVSAPIGIDPFTGTADADITPGNTINDVTPRGDWTD